MKQNRKNLKITSIIVLIFAGMALLNAVTGTLFFDMNGLTIPEGASENLVLITQIFLLVASVLFILPQLYIGIKGLKMAERPNASKGHIVWAIIMLVATFASMISPLLGVIRMETLYENVSTLVSLALDVIVLLVYIKYARAVCTAR